MNNTTPEGFRTAAYLAAKARLDARKTTRNVQCNPPNVRCGNRCIPPSWDCRLKGQGTDPHLRAVKTDPLGGLANIQRGATRITRGIVRGNFSEVEGGKRAIIRGAVKVAPGNIQQKQELQKKLEDRTSTIGVGLAVVTFGLGAHALLMKNNTFGYRNGTGRRINEAVHNGVSSVLDATPFLGAARARTRVGAFGSASEAVTRAARAPQAGPDGLVAGLPSNSPATLRNLQNLNIGATNRNGSSNLAAATSAINKATRSSSQTNVYEWDEKHRSAFWGAKVNAPDLDGLTESKKASISVFARPAAEDFLVKQYNLPLEAGGSNSGMTAIKAALATKLIEEREAHVAYAKQLGLRTSRVNKEEVISPDDLNTYLLQLNRRSGLTGSTTKAVKDAADSHVAELMTGKSLSARASRIYGDTVLGFDKLYGEVAERVASIPGAASLGTTTRSSSSGGAEGGSTSSRQRVAPAIPQGSQDLLVSLDRVRVGDMARQLGLPRSSVNGPAHAELIKSAYFANRVVRTDKTNRARFFITDRLALSAASELAGRPITTTTDAMRLLQSEYGFTGAVRVRSPREATPRPAAPSAAGQPRPARRRLRSRAELIRTLTQGGLSAEAAAAEADRIISRRGDEDDISPELVRTATYLAARADFKEGGRLGKPCGASHIPKAHECRKGKGVSSAPAEANSQSGATGDRLRAAATGALVAGLAAGGVATFRNRQTLAMGAIRGLSNEKVQAGLAKVPAQFQEPVRNLVGRTKTAVAGVLMVSKGSKLVDVDNANNMATFSLRNGDLVSMSNVGDALIMFRTHPNNTIDYGGGETAGRYVVDFTVDLMHKQTKQDRKQALGIARKTKTMFSKQMTYIPDNSFVTAEAYGTDGLGNKRGSIYQKYGFQPIGKISTHLWGIKAKGEFRKMNERQVNSLVAVLREQKRVDICKH